MAMTLWPEVLICGRAAMVLLKPVFNLSDVKENQEERTPATDQSKDKEWQWQRTDLTGAHRRLKFASKLNVLLARAPSTC
jgi:hypothetical protein